MIRVLKRFCEYDISRSLTVTVALSRGFINKSGFFINTPSI